MTISTEPVLEAVGDATVAVAVGRAVAVAAAGDVCVGTGLSVGRGVSEGNGVANGRVGNGVNVGKSKSNNAVGVAWISPVGKIFGLGTAVGALREVRELTRMGQRQHGTSRTRAGRRILPSGPCRS